MKKNWVRIFQSISLAMFRVPPIHHYLVFTVTVVVVYGKVHFLVELKMLITSEHKKDEFGQLVTYFLLVVKIQVVF